MVISDRQMGHPRACCSKWATHDAQNRWCPHGTNASRASRCSMRHTSHISCVHKNTVGGEIWCSFSSTHAFLLGNGQTYATRGVPYYRVSRIFMSRIFSVPLQCFSGTWYPVSWQMIEMNRYDNHITLKCSVSVFNHGSLVDRGVVVRERGGTPFRQIFWSRNRPLGQISLANGHRWNANTEVFQQITSYSLGWPSISLFSGPIAPKRGIWHQKSQKVFRGLATPSRTHRARARGRKLPCCWGLCLGNRSPK